MNPQELPLEDILTPETMATSLPAIGWWILVLLFALVCLGSVWWWRRYRKRQFTQSLALLELKQLQQLFGDDSQRLLQEISVLLRRVAISHYGRERVSGLTGGEWVAFLDVVAKRPLFVGKFDELLTLQAYRPTYQADLSLFLAAVEAWLITQKRARHV